MPYAAVNGIELHYRVDGEQNGDAPWIVLSNSLGSDVSMWTPQVAAFSKHFRVLRYDTRGHGHSAAPAGPYTIEQLTGDGLGLMDLLKIERGPPGTRTGSTASCCATRRRASVRLKCGCRAPRVRATKAC